jgi:hypothetical protein
LAANYIRTGADPSLDSTQGTIFAFGDLSNKELPPGSARHAVADKRDAGGVNWLFSLSTSGLLFLTSAGEANAIADWSGASVAVNFSDGTKPEFFVNGASVGLGSIALATTTNDAPITIGNGYTAPSNLHSGFPLSGVLYYTSVLSASEIASLHTWSQSRITPRKQWPGGGLRYPDRETNLITPTPASEWTPISDAVLADIENGISVSYGGSVNPYANQTGLPIGVQLQVTGEAAGDGTANPRVIASGGSWTGTTSTAWQEISLIWVSTGNFVRLWGQMAAAGTVKFRNIKVWTRPPGYTPRTGDPLFLDNIQSARVTLADETSGKLSNTPYTIESGTWAVKEDSSTGERYVNSEAFSLMTRRNVDAYGTWQVEATKTLDAGTWFFAPIASVAAGTSDSAQNGYFFVITSGEQFQLQRRTAGAATVIMASSAGQIAAGQRFKLRITRSAAGEFTVYVDTGSGWALMDSSAAGSNPVTDNNHTASLYSVFDIDTGDRLYLDRQYAGVVTP